MSLGQKTTDVSLPSKFAFMQHGVTYLMPTEGKESSAKVGRTIFHSGARRNPKESDPNWKKKHEYSTFNLHTLSAPSFGPLTLHHGALISPTVRSARTRTNVTTAPPFALLFRLFPR